MSQYVVIFSVGPVQGFIASARRSRDLWSGSWLLSELAKACAKSLHEAGALLVFPAVKDPQKELADYSDFSVGNKIQVVITAENATQIQTVVDAAKKAVQNRFAREADTSLAALDKLKGHPIRADIWEKQIPDYVEVQAAWAKFEDQDYALACDKAGSLLAARKATRDFNPAAANSASDPDFMLPKSSLDGMRETVFAKEFNRNSIAARKLSLSDGEQLDSAGVIKRLGGKVDQFTPYTRIAAHKWLADLADEEVEALGNAYEMLVTLGLATRVTGNDGCYEKFPYDGEFLYSFRVEATLKKYQGRTYHDDDASFAFKNLQNILKPLWRKYGEPCRYSVLLLADGDRMGELLDKAKTVTAHQKITKALSEFSGSVERIMRDFKGHRIYAGGDDVLGFVPLYQAYDCAKALAENFQQSLAIVAAELGADNAPTLSVGMAITHINTPLGHIRSLAQRAEKIAKGDLVAKEAQRNALGITLAVRSGSTTDIRLRWDCTEAHEAFHQWMAYYVDNELTSRIAYDTREVHLRTDFLVKNTEVALLEKIRASEFKRMLTHARTPAGKQISPELITQLNQRLQGLSGLNELATELIIARWLSAKTQNDLGRI